jgi:hypothetical protein
MSDKIFTVIVIKLKLKLKLSKLFEFVLSN